MRVFQLTDTHFFANESGRLLGVDTAKSFADVYGMLKSEYGTPDFYLFTGDLSQDETTESYRRLADSVGKANAPCYFLPGNHDQRQNLKTGLLASPTSFCNERGFINSGWQIILLDSLVEGKVGGYLANDELKFLEETLAKKADHVLICVHHHLLPCGSKWTDKIGISNSDAFFDIVDRHDNVRCVLSGHIHQAFDAVRGNVRYLATPSTGVQFKPNSDTFAVDAQPPGFRILNLEADGSVKTSVHRLTNLPEGLQLLSAGY
ncbi:MAG: 3',5'-cyclic-AMP phosphodiesterase [Candidatus Obscuribacterales bacterium]|nr:3',5'-cyclic-AMP phosphodiesterase [Candidatus Obscuribacterales bacterium]